MFFLASAPLFYFERVIAMKKWMLLLIAAVVVLIVAVIGGGFSNDAEPATLREPPQLVVEDGEAASKRCAERTAGTMDKEIKA